VSVVIRPTFLPIWLLALTLFVGAGAAQAQPNTPEPNAADMPEALVQNLTARVIASIERDKSLQAGDPAALQKFVEGQIMPFVDFETTTRLALGINWRRATTEQRARVTQEFRTLLVRTYAGALSAAPNYKVKLLKSDSTSDRDALVRTQVLAPGREPIELDYRLEQTDAGWKIYDINVVGVWLVEVYRTSFVEEVGRSGIDGLIKLLAERNQRARANKSS